MEIYNKVNELAKKSTPKFTDPEKVLLLSIIEDVKEIVENPKTDGPSMEQKATWELITDQYAKSAVNNGFSIRTEAQLKRCWINLKYRCRRSDSVRKLHQLKTGGGPPIVIDDDEEDMNEKVCSIVPTIDFTLKIQWDSTSKIENNTGDMQDIFEEKERNMSSDFNQYKRENYYESNNENVPCYLDDFSASAGSSKKTSKEILLNKRLSKNNAKSTIIKISESDGSFSRHFSKSSETGSSVQRKPLNALQNILPKNYEDFENRINKCKDLSEEPSNKKRKLSTGLEIEQDLRIQKLQDAMKQQLELHTEKQRIIRKECEYWNEMKTAANLEMQVMQAQLNYWRVKSNTIESDMIDHLHN